MSYVKRKLQQQPNCIFCRQIMEYPVSRQNPTPRTATREHIILKSKNGPNDEENIKLSCARCNNIRGNTSYEVFYAFARYVIRPYPYAPTPLLRIALQQFKDSLADLAIRNQAGTKRALSASLLSISEQLR